MTSNTARAFHYFNYYQSGKWFIKGGNPGKPNEMGLTVCQGEVDGSGLSPIKAGSIFLFIMNFILEYWQGAYTHYCIDKPRFLVKYMPQAHTNKFNHMVYKRLITSNNKNILISECTANIKTNYAYNKYKQKLTQKSLWEKMLRLSSS